MKAKEVTFAERTFSGSEIEQWSFHPSDDGTQLGIYLAIAGSAGEARFVVPWSLLPTFLESMVAAKETCEVRLAPPELPEKFG